VFNKLSHQPIPNIEEPSFFQRHQRFPSTEEIQKQAQLNTTFQLKKGIAQPWDFELPVKLRSNIIIKKEKCLYAISRLFQDAAPVPEVYDKRTENGNVYIFMQLIPGPKLEECWSSLTEHERVGFYEQL
jgi:hypothetical protein